MSEKAMFCLPKCPCYKIVFFKFYKMSKISYVSVAKCPHRKMVIATYSRCKMVGTKCPTLQNGATKCKTLQNGRCKMSLLQNGRFLFSNFTKVWKRRFFPLLNILVAKWLFAMQNGRCQMVVGVIRYSCLNWLPAQRRLLVDWNWLKFGIQRQ